MPDRILILINDLPFFLSHRLPIALEALAQGHEVHVASPPAGGIDLSVHGFFFHELPLSRSGRSVFGEMLTFLTILQVFRRVKPDLVHLVTIKPVLYGGIAARLAGVPSILAAVSGLGAVFIARGLRAEIVRSLITLLYRIALGHRNLKVIFQNPDDADLFVRAGLVKSDKTCLIRGSGVDLRCFSYVPEPSGECVVTMVSRLLVDKGVCEFVEAAKILRERDVKVTMRLIGDLDPGNPASISEAQLTKWKNEAVVEFLGYRGDIAHQYALSHIACLPSYREGLPKSLIEAAACGRAVVTTDVPGCRYVIDPEKTGVLVPSHDAYSLAGAIERLVKDSEERRRMGEAGRKFAEREFGIEGVVAAHMKIYQSLLENVNVTSS